MARRSQRGRGRLCAILLWAMAVLSAAVLCAMGPALFNRAAIAQTIPAESAREGLVEEASTDPSTANPGNAGSGAAGSSTGVDAPSADLETVDLEINDSQGQVNSAAAEGAPADGPALNAAEPNCTLSSYSVRIQGYSETLFCIEAWFQNSSPQTRVERVRKQVDAIILGRVDLHSLGILQGEDLGGVLALTPSASDEGATDGRLAGIVSSMASLRGRDRLILLVTPTDVQLAGGGSAAAVAAARLTRIQQAVSEVSEQTSWVTFNWGPYRFWRWRSSALKPAERQSEDAFGSNGLGETELTDERTPGQERLFPVQKSDNFYNAAYRGAIITDRIRDRTSRVIGRPAPLQVPPAKPSEDDTAQSIAIEAGSNLFMTILPTDYQQARVDLQLPDIQTPQSLADLYRDEIQERVERYRYIYRIHLGITLLLIVAVVSSAIGWQLTRRRTAGYKVMFWAATVSAIISIVFLPVFPRQGFLNAVLSALVSRWTALVSYLQDDFFELATIIAVTLLLLPILKWIVRRIPGTSARRNMIFYGVTLVIVAFAVVVASPHLPGAGTAYLAGVSAFAVLAFSLSAQAAIGDVIAGFILVFLTDLNETDWVRIGDVTGELVHQNLFVHKIRTPKNVVVTLQNNMVLSSLISNFSTSKENEHIGPLIVHATITLGYDVPWRKVHQVLLQAAEKTPNVRPSPFPFVLQTSLDDYYVSYELNAYTDEVKGLPRLYSHLYENIQDECNHADIEILSPHYRAVRDGSDITIPGDDWAGVVSDRGQANAPAKDPGAPS
ncbi:MAG: mechanosensitive ion channel family protein [Elainellaceae cyanobacterium]